MTSRIPSFATVIVASCLLAGCSDSRTVSVQVRGVEPLNVNPAGESTTVNLRVFALRDDDRFRAATANQLWTEHDKTLADELVDKPANITVFPGGAKDAPVEHELKIKNTAQYLGFLAMCNSADATDQRTLVLPLKDLKRGIITLNGYSVQVRDPREAEAAPRPSNTVDGPAPAGGTKNGR